MPRSRYSGSHPSTQMTTVGRCGFRYRRPFSSIVSDIARSPPHAPAARASPLPRKRVEAIHQSTPSPRLRGEGWGQGRPRDRHTFFDIPRQRRGCLRAVSRTLVPVACRSFYGVCAAAGLWPRARCRMRHRKPRPRLGRPQSPGTGRRRRYRLPYIAFAQSLSGAAGIDFVVGDACRLPYANGSFAATMAQLSLNFVPNAAQAVREMRRVMRPGGVVVAAVWDFRGGLVFQRLFWDTTAGLDPAAGAARDRLFSGPLALPDGLPLLWRDAGYRRGRAQFDHDSYGVRRFRRLLGTAAGRSRTRRRLCRRPGARTAPADRGAGTRRLSLRRAGWSALADGDCVGGARHRPLTLLLQFRPCGGGQTGILPAC